jgi:hypothetical protein
MVLSAIATRTIPFSTILIGNDAGTGGMEEAAFEVSPGVETLIHARKLLQTQVEQYRKNASKISNSSNKKAEHVGPQNGLSLQDKDGMILYGDAFDVYVGALGKANLIYIRHYKKVAGKKEPEPQDWLLIGR